MLHEFNLDVPDGMPIYLQEDLYEHLCNEHYNKGRAIADVLAEGAATIKQFVKKFPVLKKKKADVVIKDFVQRPEYADGTIVFDPAKGKYVGYYSNRIVSTALTVDSVKTFMTKKFEITDFEIKDLEVGHA